MAICVLLFNRTQHWTKGWTCINRAQLSLYTPDTLLHLQGNRPDTVGKPRSGEIFLTHAFLEGDGSWRSLRKKPQPWSIEVGSPTVSARYLDRVPGRRVASDTHTETRYNNQRPDCGQPRSFSTACGEDSQPGVWYEPERNLPATRSPRQSVHTDPAKIPPTRRSVGCEGKRGPLNL
jgi:hypothetical protein